VKGTEAEAYLRKGRPKPGPVRYIFILLRQVLRVHVNSWLQSRNYLTTDGQSSGTRDQFLISFSSKLSSDSCGFVVMGRPLWPEDGSVIYSCCWTSPTQSFSGPSSAGLSLSTFPPLIISPPLFYHILKCAIVRTGHHIITDWVLKLGVSKYLAVILYVNPSGHHNTKQTTKQTAWPESASELYRPSDRRLPAKLGTTSADRGCCVVSTTDPYGRILGFLDRSCYFSSQVAPQLYSRGWVGLIPDPLLLRKSGSAGNSIRTSGSVARMSDH
jgi:hypothetical protein